MTKSEAGKLGGLATLKKHGKDYMRSIGKRGAMTTWTRYTLKPVGTSNYAMVERETGIIKAFLNSNNFDWRM